MAFGSQLKVLLQKNCLLKKKSKVGICCDIAFPVALIVLLMVMMSKSEDHPIPTFGLLVQNNTVIYGPSSSLNTEQKAVVKLIIDQVKLFNPNAENQFKGMESLEQMDSYYANNSESVKLGLWFPTNQTASANNPFQYSIRMDSDVLPPTDKITEQFGNSLGYASRGFASLQTAVDNAVLSTLGNFQRNLGVTARLFPDPFTEQWQTWRTARDLIYRNMAGVIITAAIFFFGYRLIVDLVVEKETRIRQGMKMIGMSDIAYYLSWQIQSLYIGIPITLVILIILYASAIIKHANFGIMLLLFILYFIALIQLACVLSLFFDKSKFAGIMSLFFVVGLSVAGIFVAKENFSKHLKLLISLIAPIGFNCAIYTVALKDYNGEDQDKSIYPTEYEETGMMLLDAVIYVLLLAYLDKVIPGEFGVTEPWYFPISPNYWRPRRKSYESIMNDHEQNDDVEMTPVESASSVTVSIKNLKKEFHTGNGLRTAVDGLYLDMHSDQIHAFLGHNGAGKSTTIGMLTGLIPPTGGDAFIDGHSIASQMSQVRNVIGVCPQHDVIWKELTVFEHLKIYAALKGITSKHVDEEAEKMAFEIGLGEKINAPAGTLSGGQKRKLCLGIAFIGHSKIIFLDEVTSGMDPLSRRGVWDFLLKYKKGRTIILTTHFMDEADFLGDRIAIISHGRLRCDGSSLFLKKKFGIGYLLTCAKVADVCNTAQVTQFVQQFIPEAAVLSDVGTELSFRLPTSSVTQFVPFFRELDQQKILLGLGGYGISVTTMEEVFLRIGQETRNNAKGFNLNANENRNEAAVKKAISTTSLERSPMQQFKGLIIKRLQTSYKDLKSFTLSILLPGIILGAAIVVYKFVGEDEEVHPLTPLTFNMSDFGNKNYIPIKTIDNDIQAFRSSPYFNELRMVPNDLDDYLEKNYTNDAGAFNLLTSFNQNFTAPNTTNSTLSYTVLFNIDYVHSIPMHMNMLTDSLLRNITNNIGIVTTSLPFKHVLTTFQLQSQEVNRNAILYFILLFMGGYSLMAGSFAGNVCAERNFNIKRLLYISGCKKYVYWLSNLVWDYIFALIINIVISAVIVSVVDEFSGKFGLIFLAQILYSFGIIPLAYLMSYLFKTHGKATGSIFGIHFALAFIFLLTTMKIRIDTYQNSDLDLQKKGDIVDYVFFIISPVFCLAKVMILNSKFPGFSRVGEMKIENQWAWNACGAPILFLACHMILWLSWLFILDLVPEIRGKLKNPRNNASPNPEPNEDSDVAAERVRLHSLDHNQEVVVIKGLHRVFRSKGKNPKKIAVHNTALGIPRGQTFGLLGMNGAGKTTTLSMLSGDIIPSAGSATINGYDLISERSEALQSIGSCPQFDALIPLLTAREQLWLYCRIKGIPEHQIGETVEAFLTMMDLQPIGNSNCHGYSGGNKRKVSLSIAMLGNPSVVFLDEPSTGCDPEIRRFMWNVISELGANKVIIITTHSMEECEALCQRISIMKDGKFTCLGSNQHIKSKFGSGYSIDIKFKKEYYETGINMVLREFPSSFLLDQHDLIANFELPNNTHKPIMVSEIFSTLQNQLAHIMDDYSVSQTSLEQVFLKLTSSKHEERLDQYSEREREGEQLLYN
ncbi:hypothetical protein PPL_07550 [Heterostelium album PN500]|uniref:ABC transporter domain-containing protein n=1 Tax=Heterostelium pallidum (strain ATCC 26659 / Pp 5 / PN500) TaxID=670386 RepID=D3BG99_HETP5|nr:hypothetical protein PPL_07550 [Heterostelium album PN500]EFA79499.1 hypothetical protein PPL_07550 [Heterostelium album PN500]|eukprot:XP_020431620.1 hypothetical protein PPL_07550 [Heterostelium album PN500]